MLPTPPTPPTWVRAYCIALHFVAAAVLRKTTGNIGAQIFEQAIPCLIFNNPNFSSITARDHQ